MLLDFVLDAHRSRGHCSSHHVPGQYLKSSAWMMWALKPAPSKAGAMMIPMAQMKKLAVVTQTGTEPRLPALGSGSYQASLMWEAPAQPSLSRPVPSHHTRSSLGSGCAAELRRLQGGVPWFPGMGRAAGGDPRGQRAARLSHLSCILYRTSSHHCLQYFSN